MPNSAAPLTVPRENDVSVEKKVLGTIAKECPSLLNLRISQSRYRIEEVMDGTDLAPLFDCPLLEHINLWFDGRLELDDQGIRQMGGAWTRLETLILHAEYNNTTPISCLVALAESFPVLQRLESRFDRSRDLPPMNEVTLGLGVFGNSPSQENGYPLTSCRWSQNFWRGSLIQK